MQTNSITDYMLQNGFTEVSSAIVGNIASVFVKADKAVVFYDDVIEYKTQENVKHSDCANIVFKWKSQAFYKGFHYSDFHLMMLLDFMGAIKISTVAKQLRSQIIADNYIETIGIYGQSPVAARYQQTAPAC